jgi:hypothetical protein
MFKQLEGFCPELLNYFEQTKKSVKKCRETGLGDSTLKVLYLSLAMEQIVN